MFFLLCLVGNFVHMCSSDHITNYLSSWCVLAVLIDNEVIDSIITKGMLTAASHSGGRQEVIEYVTSIRKVNFVALNRSIYTETLNNTIQ